MNSIICFGEALWDVRPDGPVPGGAPTNVALRLARLGADVRLVSRVGRDGPGDELVAWLAAQGLSTQGIQRDARHATGRVLVDLTNPREARYEIVSPAAWDYIEIDDAAAEAWRGESVLIFGSLAVRHEVSRAALHDLLHRASLRIFDVNLRPPFVERATIESLLREADWAKFNEDELRLVGAWHGWAGSAGDLMRAAAAHYGLQTVCATLGARGAMMLSDGTLHTQQGFDVEIVDTIGCGDSFLACWTTELLARRDPQVALRRACALGAVVATRAGANPIVTQAEIAALAGA